MAFISGNHKRDRYKTCFKIVISILNITVWRPLIATDSGADPPSTRQLRCTVRLCSVIRPEYAPPPDRALSVSGLITDTAGILHLDLLFLNFYLFFYWCLLSQRNPPQSGEGPARLKRTEHGKNAIKIWFICTVVSNINFNKAVNCFVGIFNF